MDSQHDMNAEFKPEIPNENRNDGEERSAHQSGPVKQDSSIQVTTKEPPSSPHIVKNKGRGRRVRFPEDEKIVSERIPPPNPWKDSKCSLCTNGILIFAQLLHTMKQ